MRVCERKWRVVKDEKKVPRVMHERMNDERVREEYESVTQERMEQAEW